jgi:hypothetical protein
MPQKYFVITNIKPDGTVIARENRPQEYWRFEVEGRAIQISQYVKTFIWFNPMTMSYHVNELNTGSFIAQGKTEPDARAAVAKAFQSTTEDAFFDALERFGPIEQKPEIAFTEAMRRMRMFVMKNKGKDSVALKPLQNPEAYKKLNGQ